MSLSEAAISWSKLPFLSSWITTPKPSIEQLCRQIKDTFPASYQDAWYVLMEAALVACGKPEQLYGVYTYVTDGKSEGERNRINKRLRDVLQKEWILTGIAPVLSGVAWLARAEKDLCHQNEGGLSDKWQMIQLGPASYKKGTDFVDRLYAHNLRPTFENLWGSHLDDIRWQQEQIIYGVFLADHSVLSAVETELVSMTALMCGTESQPKLWHMRGFRRLGPSLEESRKIHECLRMVAAWCGKSPTKWPRPDDVEHEV